MRGKRVAHELFGHATVGIHNDVTIAVAVAVAIAVAIAIAIAVAVTIAVTLVATGLVGGRSAVLEPGAQGGLSSSVSSDAVTGGIGFFVASMRSSASS